MINISKSKIAIAVLVTAIFFQCKPSDEEIQYPAIHFDVEKLIDQQIHKLDSMDAELSKKLVFRSEESEVLEKDVDWNEELQMFRQMNINKPALAPLYDSVYSENTITYRLKKADYNSRVKELKVKFGENNFPEMIESTIIEDNYLYASEKKMMLYFDPSQKILESFEIKSKTKVILMGEDKGEIHAKIK